MRKKIAIFLGLLLFVCMNVHAEETFTMAIGPAPGFLQDDGNGSGDVLYKTIITRLKQKNILVNPEKMPWKRADSHFNESQVDLEYPALLGDRALKNAIFSAPISKVGMVIFTRKDSPKLDGIKDLKGTVGIVLGFTYPKELKRKTNIKIEKAQTIKNLMTMLAGGRIDAIIHWGAASFAAMKELGLENKLHSGKEFTLSFGCFAAHMNPKGAMIISAINQIIGEMVVTGEYQHIMKGNYRALYK